MSLFDLRPCIGEISVESDQFDIADRFSEVMLDISREYDLSPDVLAAAQEVIRALRGKEQAEVYTEQSFNLP
jgi:hypothetical protein